MKMNMKKLMEQARKLQETMLKLQEELAERTVEATSGGGMVKVVANGRQEIVEIHIDPEVVNPEDVEMLEDLVLSAVNEARRKAAEMAEEEMGKLMGGMGTGRVPGMGFF